MTVSASLYTVERLIRMAGQDCGRLAQGQNPSSEQYAQWMQRLQDMMYLWQTQGCKLFLLVDTSVTLVAGTATYTVGVGGTVNMAKPWRVEDAYYLDSSNNTRPLMINAWSDWLKLSNRTIQGDINTVFIDKQVSLINVSCWNVPNTTAATGTLHLLLRTQATGITSLTDQTQFPMEWYMALRWGLADELAVGQPQAIADKCQLKASAFKTLLDDFDVEDTSVVFAFSRDGSTGR